MLDSWLPFLIYGFFALAIPLSMIFASFALATKPHRRMRGLVGLVLEGRSVFPPLTTAQNLKVGSVGDATVISVREGTFDYVDVVGEHLAGNRKIASDGVVIGGRWWYPK